MSKILHTEYKNGTVTDLFTSGRFYCSCDDFYSDKTGHCAHTRALIAKMQFNQDLQGLSKTGEELESFQPISGAIK